MKKTVQNNHTDIFLNSFNSEQLILGKKVLDMGCGDGYASTEFKRRGAKTVHAYDPVGLYPDLCANAGIPFYDKIGQLDPPYDIVWSHHVIEHVADYMAWLRRIHSMLANDGLLWLACPNMANTTVYSPGHINNFMAPQLIEVLHQCGYATGVISIWAKDNQLRVRVPKIGPTNYPPPFLEQMKQTGRCASEVLNHWNW